MLRIAITLRTLVVVALLAGAAFGQTVNPPALPPSNVVTSALPSYLFGSGVGWDRSAAAPLSNVTSLAVQLGQGSSWYWWNTFSTPLKGAQVAADGTKTYLPTSIRTGMAYVAAQSPGGRAFLGMLVDGGLANAPSAPPSSANALAYSTGPFIALRITPNFYVLAIARATGTTLPAAVTGTNSTLQLAPEVMAFYSFGGSK